MLKIVSFFLGLLILLLFYLVKELPKMIQNSVVEAQKFSNSRQLQVESYFRQVSSQELQHVLTYWANLYTDIGKTMKELNDSNTDFSYEDLQQQTILLGSDKTVEYLSAFQQHVYSHPDPSDSDSAKATVYIAYMVASLKYDFSGYKIDPLDMIRIRIKDYAVYGDMYEKASQEIKKEVPW